MQVTAYKTAKVYPHDVLQPILDACLPALENGDIVAITSKIVSLCEGRILHKSDVKDKRALIYAEADQHLPDDALDNRYGVCLTIKNGLLIPTAGIDESNSEDAYILYPQDIQSSTTHIWSYLRDRHKVRDLGVIMTDSHTTPLRWGVTGIGIGWCGFDPLYSYIGKPDCFGKPLRMTKANVLDALAVAAVYEMGEGDEQTPLAVIRNARHLQFQDTPPTADDIAALRIDLADDLYAPILTAAPWIKK